jgi:predicted transglutaminase-like cysteine proteinase
MGVLMYVGAVGDVTTAPISWDSHNIFHDINGTRPTKQTNIFEYTSYKPYFSNPDEIINDYYYVNMFLQYGNPIIRNLAMEIVNESDSDDEKMEKIQRWVVENLEYRTDFEQYGFAELWVPPVMLLNTMQGDCEDGAFLIMSLALNAGVDPNSLRFYAGEVKAGEGAATGGHGWVAYKRSIDSEWVPIDYSYYPDLRDMDSRIPMRIDDRYVEDWLIFEVGRLIITPDTNRVKNPEIYDNYGGYVKPNVLQPGNFVNGYI